jgi:hypothetical protein
MAFAGDVVVRELGGDEGSRWRLEQPLTYRGRRDEFVVPAGFTTDFASVPQALTWLVPRYGRYTKAAILHDFLWRECAAGRFGWADADGLLRRAMRELDVPFLRRWLMWAAVRLACIATRDVRSLWQQGWVALVQLLTVAVPGIAFVAAPLVVVLVFTAVYQLLEGLTWVLLRLRHARRPAPRVNRPRLMLPR